VLPTSTSS